jgi:hypothetical protein
MQYTTRAASGGRGITRTRQNRPTVSVIVALLLPANVCE